MFRSMGLLLPLEAAAGAALVLFAVWRRGRRGATNGSLDVPERIHDALVRARLPDGAATAIATEAAVLYFALFAWKRKPFAPPGGRAFSYHRRNAYAALLYAVVGIAVVEMAAVDLIVRASHVTAANVLLVVDALAAIWLLGFARAVQLRPILLTSDALLIRNGLAARVDVPLAHATIEFGRVRAPAKGTPRYLRAAMGQPNALIALREPATLRRAYGGSRLIDRIGLVLDDPKGFETAWKAFVPETPDAVTHM
jgi:hypothetical protein